MELSCVSVHLSAMSLWLIEASLEARICRSLNGNPPSSQINFNYQNPLSKI